MKRLLAILFAIILLTGCFTKMAKDRQDLYYTAAYSLAGPNDGLSAKYQNNNVEADIETDQYGRELCTVWISEFAFYELTGTGKNSAFRPGKVKVILQKHDDRKIYYYEDFCFLLETEDGFPTDKIEELKERNDWDLPLQDEKCSSRIYGVHRDFGVLLYQWDVRDGKEKKIQSYFPGSVTVYPVAEDKNGKILCGVSTYQKETDSRKSYYVIYDSAKRSVDSENGIMELTSLEFGQELHELKVRNGWNFTDCPGE